MPVAQASLQTAADAISKDLRMRLESTKTLSDEDRQVMIDLARTTLAAFLPTSAAKGGPKPPAKTPR